jgi:hypothetical protein
MIPEAVIHLWCVSVHSVLAMKAVQSVAQAWFSESGSVGNDNHKPL